MKKLIVMVDIDGTIAHLGDVFTSNPPNIPSEEQVRTNPKYRDYLTKIETPEIILGYKPVPGMASLLNILSNSEADVFYLTARTEHLRYLTLHWLQSNGFPTLSLFMRQIDDYRYSADYKEDTIKQVLAFMYPGVETEIIVIDDDSRGRIQEMCNRNGYTFKKATSGGQSL